MSFLSRVSPFEPHVNAGTAQKWTLFDEKKWREREKERVESFSFHNSKKREVRRNSLFVSLPISLLRSLPFVRRLRAISSGNKNAIVRQLQLSGGDAGVDLGEDSAADAASRSSSATLLSLFSPPLRQLPVFFSPRVAS